MNFVLIHSHKPTFTQLFSLRTTLTHVWRNLKQLQSLHSLNSLLPTAYTCTCLTQSQTAAISICTQNILHILDFNNTTTLISQLVLKAIVRWSYFWILEFFCLKVENSMQEESFLPFVAIGKIYLYCFKYWLLKVFVSQKVNKYNLIC